MRIAWDAKRAFENSTGLGNYSRDTIQWMTQYYSDIEYSLCTPNIKKAKNSHFYNFTQKHDLHIIHPMSGCQSKIWRSYGIGKELSAQNIDIYHGLSNEIPFDLNHTSIKTVVSIHDLIFKRFPQYYSRLDRYIYHKKVKYAVQHADLILAMSKATQADLVHYYQVKREKIKIQYQSVHPIFETKSSTLYVQQIQKKYELPNQFSLMVCAFEDRKNHATVIKALKSINDSSMHLVLAGRPRSSFNDLLFLIKKLNLQYQVSLITDIDLQELNALYSMATLFIQASYYEGFGIPVLEALTKGLPCLLANNSSFPEIAQKAALYFDPNSVEELATIWKKAWHNSSIREDLKNNIDLQSFTPKILSQQLMNHYQSLV